MTLINIEQIQRGFLGLRNQYRLTISDDDGTPTSSWTKWCTPREAEALVQKLIAPRDQTAAATLPGITGVFCTQAPINYLPTGQPGYYLFRFFPDGYVIQCATTTSDIAEIWPTMQTWFHRHNRTNVGHGTYQIDQNRITFFTEAEFSAMHHRTRVEYSGMYQEDRMLVTITNPQTHYQTANVLLIQLHVAEHI